MKIKPVMHRLTTKIKRQILFNYQEDIRLLGKQAQVIKDLKTCKWVQVVHTDPEELGMFKNFSNPISEGEEKHKTEVELCKMADHVVGVGPKLSDAFRSYLRGCKKDDHVLDFTPGVLEEFEAVNQDPSERQQRSQNNLFAELRGRDTWEVSRILRLF